MDKKQLLSKSLANLLKNSLHVINDAVQKFPTAKIEIKPDGSPVTELDLTISSQLELLFAREFSSYTFYSEEKFSEWKFPMISLDPLDGTREYIKGINEWAVSIALLKNEHFQGEGWVYNPKTRELFTEDLASFLYKEKKHYRGEVSRSEWEQGLFEKSYGSDRFQIEQVGSIAYKLGRLSHQKSDFVVSLRGKNIWDIAGGTLLCQRAGLKFYSEGKEVTRVSKRYDPPLIWCHEELFPSLSKIFP